MNSAFDGTPTSTLTPSKLLTPPRKRSSIQRREGSRNETLCSSGALAGLCSCRVVLRVGMTLPLAETEFVNGTGSNRGVGVRSTLDGRWLVVVKAVRSDLILSLLRPSRGERSYCDGIGENRNRGAEGSRKYGAERAKSLRRSLSLQATWREWERLGYGPLQWMSHTQKEHLGSLALSWVSFKIKEHQPRAGDESPQAFLQLRPVIARVSRDCDIAAAVGFVDHNKKARRARVEVRDEGCVFRVNVEVDLEVSSQCRRLVRVFGQEAWRETGLGELLWMERPWRQYLAGRLSQQVRLASNSLRSLALVGPIDSTVVAAHDMLYIALRRTWCTPLAATDCALTNWRPTTAHYQERVLDVRSTGASTA